MSRNYSMTVIVEGFNPAKIDAIKQAACREWPFDDWQYEEVGQADECPLYGYGDDSLCGGESEEEFADRLAKVIWEANGGFCEIELRTTYLDELPYVDYCRTEGDYERIMAEPTPDG